MCVGIAAYITLREILIWSFPDDWQRLLDVGDWRVGAHRLRPGAMEALRQEISKEEPASESPAWHGEVLESAVEDLERSRRFYSRHGQGVGVYFLDSLFSDIDSLLLYAGIHPKSFGYHRLLSRRRGHRRLPGARRSVGAETAGSLI